MPLDIATSTIHNPAGFALSGLYYIERRASVSQAGSRGRSARRLVDDLAEKENEPRAVVPDRQNERPVHRPRTSGRPRHKRRERHVSDPPCLLRDGKTV
jgi:hypothetical protein